MPAGKPIIDCNSFTWFSEENIGERKRQSFRFPQSFQAHLSRTAPSHHSRTILNCKGRLRAHSQTFLAFLSCLWNSHNRPQNCHHIDSSRILLECGSAYEKSLYLRKVGGSFLCQKFIRGGVVPQGQDLQLWVRNVALHDLLLDSIGVEPVRPRSLVFRSRDHYRLAGVPSLRVCCNCRRLHAQQILRRGNPTLLSGNQRPHQSLADPHRRISIDICSRKGKDVICGASAALRAKHQCAVHVANSTAVVKRGGEGKFIQGYCRSFPTSWLSCGHRPLSRFIAHANWKCESIGENRWIRAIGAVHLREIRERWIIWAHLRSDFLSECWRTVLSG